MIAKKKEQRQHYAVNTRQIFICPKCERKFFVSGNVSLTCPECKKAETVPLTARPQLKKPGSTTVKSKIKVTGRLKRGQQGEKAIKA